MEKFYVTKKKYDWIVKHNGEEFGLTDARAIAIETAKTRARSVLDNGGEAEVLVANTVGMWDRVALD